jgi:predicted nucleotidyltransferase
MNAETALASLARALQEHGLEAVLIGNAAAALQGAPVTTVDFDFMFRKTPRNLRKLKALAGSLGATILRPYYPASDLFRLIRDDDALQADFMATIHGVKSFEGLRSRARRMKFGPAELLVADLADVVASKRAARRPRDRAVLETLEATLREAKGLKKNQAKSAEGGKRAR